MYYTVLSAIVASAVLLQASADPASNIANVVHVANNSNVSHVSNNTLAGQCASNTVPFLRAWNGVLQDHFYTTNATDMALATQQGYTLQGQVGSIFTPQNPSPNTVPFYYMFNAVQTDHFYSISADEVSDAVTNDGYAFLGIAGYAYPSALCGSIPLFETFNANIGDHFYTTNATERDKTVLNLGYVNRSIAAYVISN